jgi:hypothetical protein
VSPGFKSQLSGLLLPSGRTLRAASGRLSCSARLRSSAPRNRWRKDGRSSRFAPPTSTYARFHTAKGTGYRGKVRSKKVEPNPAVAGETAGAGASGRRNEERTCRSPGFKFQVSGLRSQELRAAEPLAQGRTFLAFCGTHFRLRWLPHGARDRVSGVGRCVSALRPPSVPERAGAGPSGFHSIKVCLLGAQAIVLEAQKAPTSSRSFGLRVSLLSGTRDATYSDDAESLREVTRMRRKSANDIRFDLRNSLSPTSC